MELLALHGALELIAQSPFRPPIKSDCQSAIDIIRKPHKISKYSKKPQLMIIEAAINKLHSLSPRPLIHHVKAHTGNLKSLDSWGTDTWGNHIADRVAANDVNSLAPLGLDGQSHHCNLREVLETCALAPRWFLLNNSSHTLAIHSPQSIIDNSRHATYLATRDTYHPNTPTWTTSTTKYAAAIFSPASKSLSACVTWQRICYDKGWTGRNRLKGAPSDATQDERDQLSTCELCDDDECLDHILRYCLHKDLPKIRNETIAALSTYITDLRNDKKRTNDELLLAEALRDVANPTGNGFHEGWRAWTGQWTPKLINQLANKYPILSEPSTDLCNRLRRTALQVGKILAVGARAIWAARCAAIAADKYQKQLTTVRQLAVHKQINSSR